MKELEIYLAVGQTRSLSELANIVESLGDKNGKFKGMSDSKGDEVTLDAKEQAEKVRDFVNLDYPDFVTRKYGIAQQAMYLTEYHEDIRKVLRETKTKLRSSRNEMSDLKNKMKLMARETLSSNVRGAINSILNELENERV